MRLCFVHPSASASITLPSSAVTAQTPHKQRTALRHTDPFPTAASPPAGTRLSSPRTPPSLLPAGPAAAWCHCLSLTTIPRCHLLPACLLPGQPGARLCLFILQAGGGREGPAAALSPAVTPGLSPARGRTDPADSRTVTRPGLGLPPRASHTAERSRSPRAPRLLPPAFPPQPCQPRSPQPHNAGIWGHGARPRPRLTEGHLASFAQLGVMRLLHLLVGQDLLQGPGQEHVFRLLPFIHGRDRAGGGQGWGGQWERGTGRSRRRRAVRGRGRGRAPRRKGRGVPTPARRGGRLGWARAATNPRGGGRTKPAPRCPLRHPRPVALRAQSPRRPRPAPASISSGGSDRGSGCSNNLPSPCWKEATSGPRPHGCRAGGSSGGAPTPGAGGRPVGVGG